MRRLVLILMLLVAGRAPAAVDLAGREAAYSQTGQFVVTGRLLVPDSAHVLRFDDKFQQFVASGWTPGAKPLNRGVTSTNATTLRLDPNYLVATAERLRFAFNELLHLTEPYRGRIYINLLDEAAPADGVTFHQMFDGSKHTWNCKITMPAEIQPELLLRVLVQALLFEASQRNAGPGGCEIPLWLTEGLIAHLAARVGGQVLFDQQTKINTSYSPVAESRELSEAIGPAGCFTLEQLSWPGTIERKPGVERDFEVSAHAFVRELLRLQNGGRCLGQVVRLLPRFENWQFAFLSAFQTHFPSLLDAEKWWAINSLHLGGRGDFEKWTLADSLQRLDQALVLTIERRATPESESIREERDLRSVILTMNFEQQKSMLARTISGLFALELRAAPQLFRLVSDYRLILERYVTDRAEALRRDIERQRPSRRQEVVIEATLRRLAALTELRQDFDILLPEVPAPAATTGPALSSVQP